MNQPNQRARILVIEDDRFLADILMNHLPQEEPWDLDLAMAGEDGLNKMRTTKPDIVLLDLVLPGMDGYEVLQQAKADPALADTPILIVSNLGQKEEIDKGMSLGAEDFLIKANSNVDDIRDKVKNVLEKRRPSSAITQQAL